MSDSGEPTKMNVQGKLFALACFVAIGAGMGACSNHSKPAPEIITKTVEVKVPEVREVIKYRVPASCKVLIDLAVKLDEADTALSTHVGEINRLTSHLIPGSFINDGRVITPSEAVGLIMAAQARMEGVIGTRTNLEFGLDKKKKACSDDTDQ